MPIEIQPISHLELVTSLGLYSVLEPDTEMVMRERNERSWREDEHDSPHAHAWFSSFHASEFPGQDIDACHRYLLYRMMNFKTGDAVKPWVTTTGTVGSAGEDDLVRAWAEAGRLLSAHPDDSHQTRFEVPDAWLSASTDMTVLLPYWSKPHVVEIKGKAGEVLEEMHMGGRSYDESHRRQALTTLAAANRAHPWKQVVLCEETWRLALNYDGEIGASNPFIRPRCREHGDDDCLITVDLDPPDTCSIYYWSRSWPRGKPGLQQTQPKEYFFTLNDEFMDDGLDFLRETRGYFERDELPARPDHFKWSMGKCQYCSMKKSICKPDDKAGVTKLSESKGIEVTREIRPHYSPEQVREIVEGRWSSTS